VGEMERHAKRGGRRPSRGVTGLVFRRERWHVDLRLRDPRTGKRVRVEKRLPRGTTATAAKAYARELLNAVMAGTFKPDDDEGPRLSKALEKYMEWRETNQRAGVEASRSKGELLEEIIGDQPLGAIGAGDVESYKAQRLRDVGPATLNRDLALLRHFYGWAKARGWVTAEKADEIRAVPLLK
jgi:hypothetical protein